MTIERNTFYNVSVQLKASTSLGRHQAGILFFCGAATLRGSWPPHL